MIIEFLDAYETDSDGKPKNIDISVFLDYVISITINLDRKDFKLRLCIRYKDKDFYALPTYIYYETFNKLDEIISIFDNKLGEFYKIDELDLYDRIAYVKKDCIVGTRKLPGYKNPLCELVLTNGNSVQILSLSKFNEFRRKLALGNLWGYYVTWV